MSFVRRHTMEVAINSESLERFFSGKWVEEWKIITHLQGRLKAFEVYQDRQARIGQHSPRFGRNTLFLVWRVYVFESGGIHIYKYICLCECMKMSVGTLFLYIFIGICTCAYMEEGEIEYTFTWVDDEDNVYIFRQVIQKEGRYILVFVCITVNECVLASEK